jgi:anti-sigma regulatory factor (Ser/Thr protein kinase)
VRREIAQALRQYGASDGEIADSELIFSELVGNVVRHTPGEVEVALDLSAGAPVLHVLDRGPGFTFHARLPSDVMAESGRGLYIASMVARDVVVVPRHDGGSHARVVLPLQTVVRPG